MRLGLLALLPVLLAATACNGSYCNSDAGTCSDVVAYGDLGVDAGTDGPCGSVGEPCCTGDTCMGDHVQCARTPTLDRQCAPCGQAGEPCCFMPMVLDCETGFCDLATSVCTNR